MNKYKIEWYGYNRHPSERTAEEWEGKSKFDATMRFYKEMREAAGRHYDFRQRPIIWSVTKV